MSFFFFHFERIKYDLLSGSVIYRGVYFGLIRYVFDPQIWCSTSKMCRILINKKETDIMICLVQAQSSILVGRRKYEIDVV